MYIPQTHGFSQLSCKLMFMMRVPHRSRPLKACRSSTWEQVHDLVFETKQTQRRCRRHRKLGNDGPKRDLGHYSALLSHLCFLFETPSFLRRDEQQNEDQRTFAEKVLLLLLALWACTCCFSPYPVYLSSTSFPLGMRDQLVKMTCMSRLGPRAIRLRRSGMTRHDSWLIFALSALFKHDPAPNRLTP